ncbi:aspartic peptidase domain-containing protein [Flagelloscypha sp. PMI_526]|nr:aspartic peptidase domain-containing protein [Flagelloscypha sp. PMI_526]
MPGMSLSIVTLGLIALFSLRFGDAIPLARSQPAQAHSGRAQGYDIPFTRQRRTQLQRRGTVSGSIDLVPIELENTVTAVHLDTGSSDLWVISDACTAGSCAQASVPKLPVTSLNTSSVSVTMRYGDSTTGTQASGPVAFDTATIAGLTMTEQPFVAVNSTTSDIVKFGSAGIFGLGFPSGSVIQKTLVNAWSATGKATSDELVSAFYKDGPLLSRIASTGELIMSMFSLSLQRSTIDIGGGSGTLTVGKLPDGVDESQLLWVPVRLYTEAEGGLSAPSFAPNEVYPSRWEIDIDGVFLNGQRLPDSALPTRKISNGVNATRTSALVDTGNSLLRGPADVVANIFRTIAPSFDATGLAQGQAPIIPCAVPVNLAFQIGGKMFPVDPRDFIGQSRAGDTTNCALFRWSLGDPFFRSNLVAFHYGNLTNPSVDPPRIGLLSNVPTNADQALTQAVADAQANGGVFESTLEVAPTAQAAAEGQLTLTNTRFASPTSVPSASTQSNAESNPSKNAAIINSRTSIAYLLTPLLYLIWCL